MLTSTAEYALRAATYLASHAGESASGERIAAATKVPAGYISKVMRDLVVAGLVGSQRGPNGGFTLSRPPEQISVLEVVNAVSPLQRIRSCPLGNPAHLSLCPMHRRLDDAVASIEATFRATSLAELLAPTPHEGPQCAGLTIERQAQKATNGAARAIRGRPRPT